NSDPPTSGPHLPYIAPWGVHTRPIGRELQVHNLEDGGVLVQYNCECPDLAARLKAIVQRYDKQVILAPYHGMKPKIALTAWSRRATTRPGPRSCARSPGKTCRCVRLRVTPASSLPTTSSRRSASTPTAAALAAIVSRARRWWHSRSSRSRTARGPGSR